MDHKNLCPGCFSDSSGQEPCPKCGYEHKAEETTLYLPPRTVLAEKYLIGRVLGQGGFGITYLGWDMNLDMKLAVKEFFPQGLVSRLAGQSKVISLSGTEAHQFDYWQERFLREAKTLAQFEHHPNIVSVRDFFKANGTAYMIMSYVEGKTLDQHLAQAGGKLPYDKAVEVMMPVMDALREVHEVGVMHRDISPDNIFIDNRGRVVLLDFGAARQEISGQSKSISVILKAGYAPEEQYRSRGKQGPWTDIYAVGATIYRLITGQVPPDAMDRLDEDTLKPPSEMGVGIAAEQETYLLKGLAIKAKNRYQTIDEFQEELLGSRVKPVTATTTELKECPYCGEEISAKAIKCKYCQTMLDEPPLHGFPENQKAMEVLEPQLPALPSKPLQEEKSNPSPAFLKRAFLCLEDGDWAKADEFLEQALNLEPMSAKAYIGKLMVELQVKEEAALAKQQAPISGHNNYKKALRFAEADYRIAIEGYNQSILNRIEAERKAAELHKKETLYIETVEKADLHEHENKKQQTVDQYKDYAEKFRSISGYKNADELAKACDRLAEKAAEDARIKTEQERIEQERLAEAKRINTEKQKAKIKKAVIIGIPTLLVAVLMYSLIFNYLIPLSNYNKAMELMENGRYEEARQLFLLSEGVKDAEVMVSETIYRQAMNYYQGKQYEKAFELFLSLGKYKNSEEMSMELDHAILEEKYNKAVSLLNSDAYIGALALFDELNGYRDSRELASDYRYALAVELIENEDYAEAINLLEGILEYDYKSEHIRAAIYEAALIAESKGNYRDAINAFRLIGEYGKILYLSDSRRTISASDAHTVGLRNNGTVFAVGKNNSGQLDVSNWRDIVAVAAGGDNNTYYTIGLKSDGTVIAVGNNSYNQINIENWTNIIAISAGGRHTVGLKNDGTVVAVGNNDYGQTNVSNWRDIVEISAGPTHTVGLKANGTVVATGSNDDYQLNTDAWQDIIAISTGGFFDTKGRGGYGHTIGLKSDGTAVGVGRNIGGQLNISGWNNIFAIDTGSAYTVGLRRDGTIVAVGNNHHGQLDVRSWNNIVAIATGCQHTVGLRANGTVVAAGDNEYGQANVTNWQDIGLPAQQ